MIQEIFKCPMSCIHVTRLTPLPTPFINILNKQFLSMNLSWEATFLDVIIPTLGLQFKDVINIDTSWMIFERNNKVTNVGRFKFMKLVSDVFQLLTLEKFPCAITKIIKHIIRQEGLVSTEGNRKDLFIRHAIHLLCDQSSSFLEKLPTLSIHNGMVVNTKMNCCS